MSVEPALADQARRWIAIDPDPETRAELDALLDAGGSDALADRFADRLQFGTAGLRGALGAGPNRMNRVVVRHAAAGLGAWLIDTGHAGGSVVIGYDARKNSRAFAEDTACVLAALGLHPLLWPHVVPTPVLAYSINALGCVAGVQVTASHNPPRDNGYKVYAGDGAQIVPPMDEEIAARIDAAAARGEVALGELSEAGDVPASVAAGYLDAVLALLPGASSPAERAALTIVHTALHGVGHTTMAELFRRAGFTAVHPVAEQAEPDAAFPTVSFPNPEEPGALDRAVALATAVDADIVLANDPDADRMACAVRTPDGAMRVLRGDEVGWLLADHLLSMSAGADRLVVTTIVSSSLLSKMAAAEGVHYVETLTGFKWLARAALARPDLRPVLGYEEALGYSVGALVRDKDGLRAALVMADLCAALKARDESLLTRLAAIEERYGEHRTEQWSIRLDGPTAQEQMAALMARVRANPPASVAGVAVREYRDLLPGADVVVLDLGDVGRIVVRPSGTEPKCKVYFEVVAGRADIATLRAAMAGVLGVDPGT